MLKMWRRRKGKEATRQSMVSTLKRMQQAGTPVQDILDDVETNKEEEDPAAYHRQEMQEKAELAVGLEASARAAQDSGEADVVAEQATKEKKEEAEVATKAARKKYLQILGTLGILGIASICLHETLSQPGPSAGAAALILQQHSSCSHWVVPQGQWRGCWL